MIEDREAREGEMQDKLASRETINTPGVTSTKTGKEQFCTFNQNDELLISIIFQHAHPNISWYVWSTTGFSVGVALLLKTKHKYLVMGDIIKIE